MPKRDCPAVWIELVAERVDRGAATGPVVLGEHAAVREWDRNDLAVEEPVVAGLDGGVLALDRVAILLFAADLLPSGHVLRGLSHSDVDIGIFLGVAGDELR